MIRRGIVGIVGKPMELEGRGFALSRQRDCMMQAQTGDYIMDEDRIKGSAKQAKGAIKEVAGKITGDAKTEAEGKAEKTAGKVQNAVGGAKDSIRDALDGKNRR